MLSNQPISGEPKLVSMVPSHTPAYRGREDHGPLFFPLPKPDSAAPRDASTLSLLQLIPRHLESLLDYF